ncbi:hypothetical protein NPX93_27725 [Bacillus mycoides]|uniref:Uncharacterized protein n=1 Tax=Bacillus cereus HuA2-1 TaxID=1053201 RepID=J9C461_BACCE|nr:hypothetical protein [Bacillus mycoides]EEL99358.1 N-acetylmuramoyl-L-alanine amidase family 2 [Bacillus mycoides DSM 2048]EJV85804.1 hypothetical protein IG3_01917 [Bacillus cereus HuA2-1]EOO17203.1 hypothetical protein IG9_02659 [Bacillus cereus HuA2-9]MBK5358983.1 hypothetical protein [Bacillus sp. TH44]MCQ6536668.1 hypothetical protein [Bacillus mycoides]
MIKYLGGTDHEDQLDYLKSHGGSGAQSRADVQRAYNNSSVDVSVPESHLNQQKYQQL